MKAVFIKDRSLTIDAKEHQFKRGQEHEVNAATFDTLSSQGLVVTAGEWAAMERLQKQGKDAIVRAVATAKAIGAIEPKDETVLAGMLERFEAGSDAQILCELVQAKYSKPVEDELAGRVTARVTDPDDLSAGRVTGTKFTAGVDLRDACMNGYVKARTNMDTLLKNGNVKAAQELATSTALVLKEHVGPIYAKGGDFGVKDVVRAADNVDPSVGTLGTGLVLMRNMGFLKNKLTFLDKISTDLRNEPVQFGQNVLTRYITPPAVLTFVPGVGMTSDATTIAEWKATITATNPAGTAPTSSKVQTLSAASATDINVVLNNYKGVELTFNNLTLGGTMRNLFAEQQAAQIYSLALQINKDLLTTLFSATWTGQVFKKLSINGNSANLNTFGLPNLVTVKNAMSLNLLPDTVRFVLLHSSYHDAILTDTNLLTAKAILSLIKKDAGSFEDGELPPLFGLSILESQLAAAKAGALVTITDPTAIPTAADTIGFAGNAASALFVARIPTDYTKVLGEIPATAALEVITEPDSGLSMLLTKRVDHNLQQTFVRCGLMYNFAQGDPRQGIPLNP